MPRPKVEEPADQSDELIEAIAQFFDDPLGFVYFAFPWGKAGTPLHDQEGPDLWQAQVLDLIGQMIRKGYSVDEATRAAIQLAVASGHGVGKTALVAWIILWFMSTRVAPQIVVTANTTKQLETKTWRELRKWHRLAVNEDWFQYTATKFYKKDRQEDWFAAAVPWSKEKAESFAGTHDKHVLIIFDEASAIDDAIWEVAEGAMTTPGAMWIVFGNPTRNSGRFRECFRKFRHRWTVLQVDSRKAKMANRKKIDQWIEDYGEDSDFVRVRVKGMFPRAGTNQLISLEDVGIALKRNPEPKEYFHAPLVISVDVARFGDDQSVILIRQGPKIHKTKKYRELDTQQLAYRVMEEIDWCKNELGIDHDALFVDVVGIGAGVVDKLTLAGHEVIEVNGGEKADDPDQFYNKRSEMWWRMREWIQKRGALPDGDEFDSELVDDLTTPEYGYSNKDQVQLEKKEDMKDRGLPSPDSGDALADSFYMPVTTNRTVEDLKDKLLLKLRLQGQAAGSHMSR